MSGSHAPFSRQVPREIKHFLPEEHLNSVNAYDNSVWYTDLVLNELLQAVREQASYAWTFCSSDPGEYVTGNGSTDFPGSQSV